MTDLSVTAGCVDRLLALRGRWQHFNGDLELRDDGIHRHRLEPRDLAAMTPRELRAVPIGEVPGPVLPLPCSMDQFVAFAQREGLIDAYVARRLSWLRRGAQRHNDGQTGMAPKRVPLLIQNEEIVLNALVAAGYEPENLPPDPRGMQCPAKAATRIAAGLSGHAFQHAWRSLMASGRLRRRG